jgi:AcrR family transcriptional regulator
MSPRPYDVTRRRAASEETRGRMLDAAQALIGGRTALSEFSMEAVAERAGVARMTVYNQFGSRTGLLEGLADRLAAAGGMARMPSVFREPDPERALRALVEVFVGFWASDRVTLRRLRALGVAFPAETGVARQRDAWRREAVANLLGRGRTVPSDDTIDVITALTSFETFDGLCVGRRRPDEVARLLGDLAVRVAKDTLRSADRQRRIRSRYGPASERRDASSSQGGTK